MPAGIKAGYSYNYAWKNGKRLDKLAKVGMETHLQILGLTDEGLADHAIKGLNASRNFIVDGKPLEGVSIPEWSIRHKYFESICKITGKIKDKLEITGKDGAPLPMPVINIYGNRNQIDRPLHTEQSPASSTESRLSV